LIYKTGKLNVRKVRSQSTFLTSLAPQNAAPSVTTGSRGGDFCYTTGETFINCFSYPYTVYRGVYISPTPFSQSSPYGTNGLMITRP